MVVVKNRSTMFAPSGPGRHRRTTYDDGEDGRYGPRQTRPLFRGPDEAWALLMELTDDEHKRLFLWACGKVKISAQEADERCAWAEAMLQSARTWDVTQRSSLLTWVSAGLLLAVRTSKYRRTKRDTAMSDVGGSTIHVIAEDEIHEESRAERAINITLSSPRYALLRGSLRGTSVSDIASATGCTHQNISQKLQRQRKRFALELFSKFPYEEFADGLLRYFSTP